jgi:serine/threonine protein kinase
MESGTKLGHYTISSLIGKGGMGEVYQAKDEKLGRQVAIKVLPEEFARDTDRVARFRREAQLLASLNHPNIAAIHGLEETDGTHFLVLELVESPTLADRIQQGATPVEEALKLALQISEALEAAHEKGVIHRDLKPANINVTEDGKVKVLDFVLLIREVKVCECVRSGHTAKAARPQARQTLTGFLLRANGLFGRYKQSRIGGELGVALRST